MLRVVSSSAAVADASIHACSACGKEVPRDSFVAAAWKCGSCAAKAKGRALLKEALQLLSSAASTGDDGAALNLEVGARVEAQFGGGEEWFAGTVTRVVSGLFLSVLYDDGDREAGVRPALVRPAAGRTRAWRAGMRVQARFGGGDEWFSGKLTDVISGGYSIAYDDGDREEAVPPALVRPFGSGKGGGRDRSEPPEIRDGTLVVPEGVRSIDHYAYSRKKSITAVKLPRSLRSVGHSAFDGCKRLAETVPLAKGQQGLLSGDLEQMVASGEVTRAQAWSMMGVPPPPLALPAGVETVGNAAFRDCTNLTALVLPESLRRIGDSAFQGCANVAVLTLPRSLRSVGMSAFSGCASLSSVTFRSSNVSIGRLAFHGCSSLSSVSFARDHSAMQALLICRLKCSRAVQGSTTTSTGSTIGDSAELLVCALQSRATPCRIAAYCAGERPPGDVASGAFSGCPCERSLDLA